MNKLEQKLQELGYRVSMTQTFNEVVIKTWLKEIDATNFHWVQTINGEIMNSMSDKPNELQNDLEVLREYENVKGNN